MVPGIPLSGYLHDRQRDRWLETNNIRVVRVLAADILKDEKMASVLASIERAAAPSTASRSPSPICDGGGSIC
jgi:very-short-patch-repair endonuclease